jgi:hypothetical protein
MANYTLTYSEGVKGFPSFYSYYPDYMIGMNNYFYSFKNGNLYRHNVNALRNTYYGTHTASSIKSVFNQSPLEVKLFKTISLESDSPWGVSMTSDMLNSDGTAQSGTINSSFFVKKESEYFAYIRTSSSVVNWNARSGGGLGKVTTVGGVLGATTLTFNVSVGTEISIGDTIYFCTLNADGDCTNSPTLSGVSTAIDTTTNVITVNTAAAGNVPTNNDYIMFMKNAEAQALGIRGHYAEITLTNSETTAVELFSVGANIFKSYP